MIKTIRRNKYSLELHFDLAGAKQLAGVLEKALVTEGLLLELELDLNSNFSENTKVNRLRIVCNEQEDKLSYKSGTLTLELDSDGLDSGLQKLQACLAGKDFYPAEFCDVFLENIKQEITVYGFLESRC